MFYEFESRLLLQGTLTTHSALRIGVGRNLNSTDTDLPVFKDVLGKPLIPGSSFKGVLRSRVEALLRSLLPGRREGACNPLDDKERCIAPDEIKEARDSFTKIDKEKRTKNLNDGATVDSLLSDWVEANSCIACQLFGSPWMASRVQVRDWQVDERYWFGQYQVRNGVAIERDTETAGDSLLYSYEVVPAGTLFHGTIVVENATDWQLGLLFAGLQEFEHSLPLGGAISRGLGAVKLEWDVVQSQYIDKSTLWSYLEDNTQRGIDLDDLVKGWRKAMRRKLDQRIAQAKEGAHA